ncbi:MAG: hypothetical protein A2201_07160 [Alicyclobacillus sp. RIFOXYA1_FULL_53_8]|nr:MAG: hypothetical protein A2201_07160 [Alicyclobacillus sp. RIFOXYA1_FULL_53_8]
MSCALYTSKAGLKTVVLSHGTPQLKSVDVVRNMPGIMDGISGEQWLQSLREQVLQVGGELVDGSATSLNLQTQPLWVVTADGTEWAAKFVVLAVNLGFELLERQGFDLSINEHVPSRKIRKVNGVGYDGKTNFSGVYVAGLLADIPSQAVIAAGQGAYVGVQIASEHLGKPFMWHD